MSQLPHLRSWLFFAWPGSSFTYSLVCDRSPISGAYSLEYETRDQVSTRNLFDIFAQLLVGAGHLARFIRCVDPVLADKSVYLPADSMDGRNVSLLEWDASKEPSDRADEGFRSVVSFETEVVERLGEVTIHGFDLPDRRQVPIR